MASLISCLLLVLTASAAVATPPDAGVPALPTLDITVDYSLGRPLFGDELGPFPPGIDLTLICSSSEQDLELTWWDGDSLLQLEDSSVEGLGRNARSIVLEALSVLDDGRSLTCKTADGQVENTVSIVVEEPEPVGVEETFFDIIVNEETLDRKTNIIEMMSGSDLKLICVVQGYQISVPSWFEDDSYLGSETSQSSYSASSVLTLSSITSEDSGRLLTCRSDGSVAERTVELQVFDTESLDDFWNTIRIVLIVVCVVGGLLAIVLVAVLASLSKQYKEALRNKEVSKVSDLFKKYALLPSVNESSKNGFSPQLTRGPYKPCTVLIDPNDS